MKHYIQRTITTPAGAARIDLNDFLPEGARRGGTWNFADPEQRHQAQMKFGLFVNAAGTLLCADPANAAMPTFPSGPSRGYLMTVPVVALNTILDMVYEDGEPGLELANGESFKTFGDLQNSAYWLKNYQSQEMVINVRPGTYYNVIGNFHWNPAQRLTIRAKYLDRRPTFVKRRKVNGMELTGGILNVRNDCRTFSDAIFRLENIILEGGVSIMDPGSAAIVGMYGNHFRGHFEDCTFRRGNNGPVNYPDRRPAGDDWGFYDSSFVFDGCDFIDNGNSSVGYASATHSLYITHSKSLTVTDCRFLATDRRTLVDAGFDIPGGHMAKIGAYNTVVSGCLFDNSVGAYTACIEYPYGGNLSVSRSTFLTGDNTTGAGGLGGAQIQAMNEWAAHGIFRPMTQLVFLGNRHIHHGTRAMRDFLRRDKVVNDPANPGKTTTTAEHMMPNVHEDNYYTGPGFVARPNNFLI